MAKASKPPRLLPMPGLAMRPAANRHGVVRVTRLSVPLHSAICPRLPPQCPACGDGPTAIHRLYEQPSERKHTTFLPQSIPECMYISSLSAVTCFIIIISSPRGSPDSSVSVGVLGVFCVWLLKTEDLGLGRHFVFETLGPSGSSPNSSCRPTPPRNDFCQDHRLSLILPLHRSSIKEDGVLE